MDRVGDREGKMERYCSTRQSPQRAVLPTEEKRPVRTHLTGLVNRAVLNALLRFAETSVSAFEKRDISGTLPLNFFLLSFLFF
jgi:hypothetical protein